MSRRFRRKKVTRTHRRRWRVRAQLNLLGAWVLWPWFQTMHKDSALHIQISLLFLFIQVTRELELIETEVVAKA